MGASVHRYDPTVMIADYLRAGGGMAVCFGPLLLVEESSAMVYILAAIGAVFAVFGLRTLLRHATTVELSAEGVRTSGPVARMLAWRDLSGMKLAYFSTRRDKKKGWMELKLKGGSTSMAFDSSLAGFDEVVEAALHAADANRIALSDVTRANLDAMGFAAAPGALPDDHL